jgi:predicted transcriptional regulator
MENTKLSLQDKLKRASELQKQIDSVKTATAELKELKFDILLEMNPMGVDKMAAVDGYYALKVATSKRYIENPEALQDWILANELSIDDYMDFNSTKVLELADEIMEKDGEILPGIEISTVERVDIKAVKGKK